MERTKKNTGKVVEKRGPNRPLRELKVLTFKGGTPTKYTDSIPQQIYTMATLALTIEQMARSLNISVSTLNTWLRDRPGVREAYEKGKWEADFAVEQVMQRKVMGYEYDRTKEYSGVDSLGREWTRTVTETVRVEPDTTALIFYMKNRHPDRWRESITQANLTQVNVQNMDLSMFSEDERKMMRQMAIKRLANENGIPGS
jgi:hypothetical protein